MNASALSDRASCLSFQISYFLILWFLSFSLSGYLRMHFRCCPLKFYLSELLFGNQEQAQLKDTTRLLSGEICWLVSFRKLWYRNCSWEIKLQQLYFKEEGQGMHFREEFTDGFNKIGKFNFFKLSGSLYYSQAYFCIPEIFSNRL